MCLVFVMFDESVYFLGRTVYCSVLSGLIKHTIIYYEYHYTSTGIYYEYCCNVKSVYVKFTSSSMRRILVGMRKAKKK